MDRKIIKYEICEANNYRDLQELVNFKIASGYQPFGNLVYNDSFQQPIVKYEDKKTS